MERFAQWNKELGRYSEYMKNVLSTQEEESAMEEVSVGFIAQHTLEQHIPENEHATKRAT